MFAVSIVSDTQISFLVPDTLVAGSYTFLFNKRGYGIIGVVNV